MNIKERTELKVKDYRRYLAERIKALSLLSILPTELLELDGEAGMGYKGTLELTYFQSLNTGVDLIKLCKMSGIQGILPTIVTKDSFRATGKCVIGEVVIIVNLYGFPKPAGCIIEEYTETVTRYRSKCPQEEVKE